MSQQVTDSDFQKEVLDIDKLVLVDFWADWCVPCKMLGPVIDQLGEEMKDKVKVVKLDVDNNPETQRAYQIMSLPTVTLFKNGQPVKSFIGVQPKQNYVNAVDQFAA